MGYRLCRAAGILAVFVLLLTPVLSQQSSARQWRATPQAQASEYVVLTDNRSSREMVTLFWLTPQLFPDDAANQAAREILGKYMLLGIVHADIGADGSPSFRKIQPISIEPNKGTLRDSIDESVLPAGIAGGLKSIQVFFQQTLGPLGRGMHWFVFDSTDLPSCGEGGFIVPYDGVRYSYETPLPGCPRA